MIKYKIMENSTSNQLGKAIVGEVEKTLRLFLDKMCNKYKSIDREVVRESCKETMGIEIKETRREFLEKQWDPKNEFPFSKYKNGSKFKAKWICEKGHRYPAIIKNRMKEKYPANCSYCSNKKICEDGSNSLGVLRPEFIKEWDPENELSIFKVSVSSHKMAKWICEKGHRYPAIINSRTGRGDNCPVCSNKKIADDKSNSLGVLRPEFIKEWDPENEFSIYDVTVGSEKIAKWICSINPMHKWPSIIYSRTRKIGINGCPCCAGKKISEDGSNSLGVLRPEFIKEWDPENELSIFEVTEGSSKYIAKWICNENSNHKWSASIYARTSKTKQSGCPDCNKSKGENFVNIYLSENNIEFTTQYKISYRECNNLRIDFYIEDMKTCIEFDGIQHFEEKSYFGDEDDFAVRIRNDNYKNLYCKENRMSIIRIHHLDIHDTEHLSNLIAQINMENPRLILSKNYPKDWLYTMY